MQDIDFQKKKNQLAYSNPNKEEEGGQGNPVYLVLGIAFGQEQGHLFLF